MRTVDTPIVIKAATSVTLRPMRSPKWPKKTAPIGRGEEGDREGGEGLQDGRGRIAGREEQRREDEDCRRRIHIEVEEFDRGADQAREQNACGRIQGSTVFATREPATWAISLESFSYQSGILS